MTPKQAQAVEQAPVSSPSSTRRHGPPTEGEVAEAARVAKAAKLDGYHRGNKRWYFVSRAGLVPYLVVSDKGAARLGKGELALVEDAAGAAWLVEAAAAAQIAGLDPEWIRCWANGR